MRTAMERGDSTKLAVFISMLILLNSASSSLAPNYHTPNVQAGAPAAGSQQGRTQECGHGTTSNARGTARGGGGGGGSAAEIVGPAQG